MDDAIVDGLFAIVAAIKGETRDRALHLFEGLLGIVVGGAVLDLLAIRSDLEAGKARLDRLDLDTLRADGLEGSLTSAAVILLLARRFKGMYCESHIPS